MLDNESRAVSRSWWDTKAGKENFKRVGSNGFGSDGARSKVRCENSVRSSVVGLCYQLSSNAFSRTYRRKSKVHFQFSVQAVQIPPWLSAPPALSTSSKNEVDNQVSIRTGPTSSSPYFLFRISASWPDLQPDQALGAIVPAGPMTYASSKRFWSSSAASPVRLRQRVFNSKRGMWHQSPQSRVSGINSTRSRTRKRGLIVERDKREG